MQKQFSEKQKFSFLGIKLVLIILFLFFAGGAVRQIFLGIPLGNRPMSDTGIALVTGFVGLLLLVAYMATMKTVITEDGITVTFFPFLLKKKTITWDTLQAAYVREYSPIGEYGGWGFRMVNNDTTLGGSKALNVKGSQGLQLVFKNGEKLLIGTQQPRELEAFLREINRGQP